MEYTVHQLAQLSGVSTRTLRYYDQIGLLPPSRTADNGYRIYGEVQVNRLQQILFYREFGMALEEIGRILDAPDYDPQTALESHLSSLLERKDQLERLIDSVSKTIGALRGENVMSDSEKFAAFKQKMLDENESAYGAEIREKYGDDAVNQSYGRVADMTEEQWKAASEPEYEQLLREAFYQNDPAGETAQKACDLHRQWLCMFWKEGTYSKAAHLGMGEMYAEDPRFAAHYDRIAPGCAAFFRDAIRIYCGKENEER